MAITREELTKLKAEHGIDAVDVAITVLNGIRELSHKDVNEYLNREATLIDGHVTHFEDDVESSLRDYKILTDAILVLKNYSIYSIIED